MAEYDPKYPKPAPDKTVGRSASKVSTVPRQDQKSISGTMGKHQRTGSGAEGQNGK